MSEPSIRIGFSPGSVPGLKASKITFLSQGFAGLPVAALTRTKRIPGGMRHGIGGSSSSARALTRLNTGASTLEPAPPAPSGPPWSHHIDRPGVVQGKDVAVRVDRGGRRHVTKK